MKELTPLEGGIGDSEALEGWVRMMNGKVEMITEEMKRLQGKINRASLSGLILRGVPDSSARITDRGTARYASTGRLFAI